MKIFFTDITTHASNFCLLHVNKLSTAHCKHLIMIDPGVYELTKHIEYSKIDRLHQLAQQGGYLISIDYPCDMNPLYSYEFIEKSVKNNLLYADKPWYVCTIQFHFQNYFSFVHEFEYLEEQIDFKQKIIGIGNLCRIMRPNQFTDHVFSYLRKKGYFYHFYGLALALIKKYLSTFHCSFDSTKWTRAVDTEFKKSNGVACRKHNRDAYFLRYINEIQKTMEVIY